MKIDSNRKVSISMEITENSLIGTRHCSYTYTKKYRAKTIWPKNSHGEQYTKVMIAFYVWSVIWNQIFYSFMVIGNNNKMNIWSVRSLAEWASHLNRVLCSRTYVGNTHTLINCPIIAILLCLSTFVSELYFLSVLKCFSLLYLLFIRIFPQSFL